MNFLIHILLRFLRLDFLTPGGMIDKNLTRLLILVIFGMVTFFGVAGVLILVDTYFLDINQSLDILNKLTGRRHSNSILNLLIGLTEIIILGVPLYLIIKIIKKSPHLWKDLWRGKTMKEIAEQHDKENAFGKHVQKELDSYKKWKNKDK